MELVERILTNLTPSLEAEMQQLEQAFQNDDVETIATLAHRLKGTAANVAAKRFESAAACLEQSSRDGQSMDRLQGVFDLMSEEHRRLIDEIESRRS